MRFGQDLVSEVVGDRVSLKKAVIPDAQTSLLHELLQVLLAHKSEEVPEGFAYISAGRFTRGGGDAEFLQNLEYGEKHLEGFFMSRFEVTFGEYLEFLNARADSQGEAEPLTDEVKTELASINRELNLVPVNEGPEDEGKPAPLLDWDGLRWTLRHPSQKDMPLIGISYLAAVEYARWRTDTDGKGWRYRLPDDDQWEKAARGADGRVFVWGDYMVWSFSWNKHGVHSFSRRKPSPARVTGPSPFDEIRRHLYGARR